MSVDSAAEMLEHQREIVALREANNTMRMIVEQGIPLLVAIIERYQAAIRSTGAIVSDDELAMVAMIRKDARV
jgi:hypothetical protein